MKFCVIGLGRLGYQVATTLADHGMEVLAIDSNESIIASIRDKVTQAICMRVTDENSLRTIGIDEMDTVIVAMGENFAQSVLITALLKKKLNVPQVIARAIDEIHKDILQLVGADQYLLPEREVGIRIAENLSSPFVDLIHLDDTFSICQVQVPDYLIGSTIQEADFFGNFGIKCIGVKHNGTIIDTEPEYVITGQDKLILSGKNQNLERFAKQ